MKREFHDGREDGFEPIEPLDVRSADSFAEMLRRMSRTAFGGRSLGEAFQVLHAMAQDHDCVTVVTVSGAMTVAKMGRVLCEMIDSGLAHIVVCTGAIIVHDLSEASGGTHYKHDPQVTDTQLFQWGYDRIHDTLEMEASLSATAEMVDKVLEGLDWTQQNCSWQINREIGRHLAQNGPMSSILGCAYEHKVPVYVPAFTDSELGLDVATHSLRATKGDGADNPANYFSQVPAFNPFLDLYDFTRRILGATRLGIFTVGGGVPRNWAQQVGPFVDVVNRRLGTRFPVPRYHYGIRICPEPVHWGGLSGCTYSEGVSWGKFVGPDEGGRFAEVHCDATIAWPLLVRAFLETRGDPVTEE